MTIAVLLSMNASGWAQGVDTTNADFPPAIGVYISVEDISATYSVADLEIVQLDIVLKPFADTATRVAEGNNEREIFDALLTGTATVDPDGSGPDGLLGPFSFSLTGLVETVVTDRLLSTTGLFDTEIVSMNLSGDIDSIGVEIRESPTAASLGMTDIIDLGGGLYHIDSFFDVFTELSVDGGQTWIASDSYAHMVLVPEPATLGLLIIGGLVLLRRRQA